MPDRPNITVILCDQMRRQAMSCTGDPNVSTPNMDRLADEGTRFENACSTYPICVPTRFSLMTGEYAHSRFVPGIDWRMSPAEHTIADELGEAGYETAMVGKWHLAGMHRYLFSDEEFDAGYLQNRTPIPEPYRGGFDHWRGFELRNAPFDTAYFRDDEEEPQVMDEYQTDGLFDVAESVITDEWDGDRPFFQIISVEPPHPPYIAPEEYLESVCGNGLELRENVPELTDETLPRTHSRWGSPTEPSDDLFEEAGYFGESVLDDLRAYYAMVENLDANIGRYLEFLEEEGLRDSTAVMFISDHGEMLGSQGLTMKQHPYEESVGIPFVVSHPGEEYEAGQTVATPTSTEDWYPTIRGLAGLEPEDSTPGADLTPLLRGKRETLDREGVLLEFVAENRDHMPYSREPWRAFRTERYKYTVKGGPRGAEPWQLFDLAEDPYEQNNLVDAPGYEDIARKLHGNLRHQIVETGDMFRLQPAFGHKGVRNVLD